MSSVRTILEKSNEPTLGKAFEFVPKNGIYLILGAIRIFLGNPKPALTPIFTVFHQIVSEIPNKQI